MIKHMANWKARSFQYLKQSCFVFEFLFPKFSMSSFLLVFNEPWFLVFWAVCEDSLVFLAINICLRVLSSSLKENIIFLLFCSTMRCLFYHYRQLVEKAMAPHSSTLAWKIPRTEEPGRLQSMRSLRVGHDWATSLLLFTFMHWRRTWQPTPVFLPGESQGWRSLVGCCLWGRTESGMTEVT